MSEQMDGGQLLDFPEELLLMLFHLLDGVTLCNLASVSPERFVEVARRVEHLRIPRLTPNLQGFLSHTGIENLRTLDLSNCYSDRNAIEKLILSYPSIVDLNIVNCNLELPQVGNILETLENLDTFSFSYVGDWNDLSSLVRDKGNDGLLIRSPIRRLYVEVFPGPASAVYILKLLVCFESLRHLHVHVQGALHEPVGPSGIGASATSREKQIGPNLETLVVTTPLRGEDFVHSTIDFLLCNRTECEPLDEWEFCNMKSYVFDNGNLNLEGDCLVEGRESELVRNSSAVLFRYPVKLSRGKPRGLRMYLDSPVPEIESKKFFSTVRSWASDLVELDVTDVVADLPGMDWSVLVDALPNLEALAVPYFFFPVATEETLCLPPKKQRRSWQQILWSYLERINLKRLFVVHQAADRRQPKYRDYTSIGSLPHLVELTMDNIYSKDSILEMLGNDQLRIARLKLRGTPSTSNLRHFIDKSTQLKYFKLEMLPLNLNSRKLWIDLLQMESLEELCLTTHAEDKINLATIRKFVLLIFGNVRVLHVHCDKASNRFDIAGLLEEVRLMSERIEPDHEVYFESGTLEYKDTVHLPRCYPGRNLCRIANHIGGIQPKGWSLL